MTDGRPVSAADKAQAWLKSQLDSGFKPNDGAATEYQQAAALNFIAYALGQLVSETRELRRAVERLSPHA